MGLSMKCFYPLLLFCITFCHQLPDGNDFGFFLLNKILAGKRYDSTSSRTVRRKLTFSNNGSTLYDFPVLIVLSEVAANIDYSNTRDQGEDLCFYDPDGTALKHEIEKWDEQGTSYIWVRVRQIESGSADYIWMYYGSSTGSCNQEPAGVWDDNFKAVWHMNNDPSSSEIIDSKNSNNGKASDGMNAASLAASITGQGLYFNGNEDEVKINDSQTLRIASNITLEAVINLNTLVNNYAYILEKGLDGHDNYGFFIHNSGINGCPASIRCLAFEFEDTSYNVHQLVETARTVPSDQWLHIAIVLNPGLYTLYFYINGEEVAREDFVTWGLNSNITHPLFFGKQNGAAGLFRFQGVLDEIRISDTSRNGDWIKAQSTAILNNNGFVSYGSEESL